MSERVGRKRAKSEKTDTGEKKEVSNAMRSSKVRSIKSVRVKDSLFLFLPSFLPSSFSAFLSRKGKNRSDPHLEARLTYGTAGTRVRRYST